MKILQTQTPLVLLLLGFTLPVFAQPRMVIRTNQRGQIVRLTVSTNNRILRQEVIGSIDLESLATQQQPQQRQQQQRQAPAQQYAQPTGAGATKGEASHFVSFSIDLLIQSGKGLSRMTVLTDPTDVNTGYGAQFPFFGSGNIGAGAGGTFTYMHMFPSYFTMHGQLEVNTTGWLFVALNLGLGARIPVRKMFFLVDGAFSLGMTGGNLPRIADTTPIVGSPDNIMTILALFGFRARVGVQFALPRNTFFTLYASYSAYPWGISSAPGETRINSVILGESIILDGFKLGFEFSWKINVAKSS